MMDSAELDLIRSSMRHIVATATPFDFAATLSDNGWHDLLDDDPAVAIGLLGEEVGSQISPLPLLDLVLQHGLAGRIDATTAVLLPPMRRGSDATTAISAVVDGTELVANGMLLSGHERARSVWTASIAGVFAIDRSALTTMPLAPHDSELGLCASTGRVPVTAVTNPVSTSHTWPDALAWGRRANASVLIGSAQKMLDNTLTYVQQRHQYSRSIGSFQTVKHRLADVHVAIAAARAGVATAWADRSELSAQAAAVLAARAQHLAATHCHQVHGGIAFTVEHGFHRFIRRGQIVSGLLGHPDDLTREIGQQITRLGKVPRTPQLA